VCCLLGITHAGAQSVFSSLTRSFPAPLPAIDVSGSQPAAVICRGRQLRTHTTQSGFSKGAPGPWCAPFLQSFAGSPQHCDGCVTGLDVQEMSSLAAS
jgi:hypothetical protein